MAMLNSQRVAKQKRDLTNRNGDVTNQKRVFSLELLVSCSQFNMDFMGFHGLNGI